MQILHFKMWYKGICFLNNIILTLLPLSFFKQKLKRDFASRTQIFARKFSFFFQHTYNNFLYYFVAIVNIIAIIIIIVFITYL